MISTVVRLFLFSPEAVHFAIDTNELGNSSSVKMKLFLLLIGAVLFVNAQSDQQHYIDEENYAMGMDANGLPLDHIDEEDLKEDHIDDDIQEDYGSGGPTVKGCKHDFFICMRDASWWGRRKCRKVFHKCCTTAVNNCFDDARSQRDYYRCKALRLQCIEE